MVCCLFSAIVVKLDSLPIGNNEKLPPLVPQTTQPPRMRNCMQCDDKALSVVQCPSSGLWFCDDECREQYRQEETAHFSQMIEKKVNEAANANLRRSLRKKKPLEIIDTPPPQPTKKATVKKQRADEDHHHHDDDDDDHNERPRKSSKLSKTDHDKKRSRVTTTTTTGSRGRGDDHANVRLSDALSPRLFRMTEDQKRALRTGRAKLLNETSHGNNNNEEMLKKLKEMRDSLLKTYQDAIDQFNTYMDHLEQAMEQWQAMRLAPDDRYDTFQDYLANTRARVEKLRTAYDAAEENYSDEALNVGGHHQQPQHDDQEPASASATSIDNNINAITQRSPPNNTNDMDVYLNASPPHSPSFLLDTPSPTRSPPSIANQKQQQKPVPLTPFQQNIPSTSSSSSSMRDNDDTILFSRRSVAVPVHSLMQPQTLEELFNDATTTTTTLNQFQFGDDDIHPEPTSDHDDTFVHVSNNNSNRPAVNDDFVTNLVTPPPVKVKTEPTTTNGGVGGPKRLMSSPRHIVLDISSDESEEDDEESSEEEEEKQQILIVRKKKSHAHSKPLQLLMSPPPKKATPPKASAQTTAPRPMSEDKKHAIMQTIQTLSSRLEKDAAKFPPVVANKTESEGGGGGDLFKEVSTIDDDIKQRHHNVSMKTHRDQDAKKRVVTNPNTTLPHGAQLQATGQHQIWNTRAPLSDKFMRDSDYKLVCKSPDGTMCFYVNQPVPVGGAFNQWISFIETQWSVEIKTRADIVVTCANGDPLSDDLMHRLNNADPPIEDSVMDAESDLEQSNAQPTRAPSTRQRNKKRRANGAPKV